jgi:hypothetical protein
MAMLLLSCNLKESFICEGLDAVGEQQQVELCPSFWQVQLRPPFLLPVGGWEESQVQN